jgi:hypothetical protein
MNVHSISTAIKVGTFTINNNGNKARLRVDWELLGKDVLQNDAGRVYVLAVNGVVKKIGGSVSKGGIKSTMSFYESANCGRPSIRSFGIQQLIYEEILLDRYVEIYMISSEQVSAPVKGLFGSEQLMISAFKEMEEKCLKDYVSIEGQYPDWNYQESGKPWEQHIQEAHAQHLANSASK